MIDYSSIQQTRGPRSRLPSTYSTIGPRSQKTAMFRPSRRACRIQFLRYFVRQAYSKGNKFVFSSGTYSTIPTKHQVQYILAFGNRIGQNASFIRHVEIPFPIERLRRHRSVLEPNLASLEALWKTFTGLNTLTFRLSKWGVFIAKEDRAAFEYAIHVLNEHLQQHALVQIICIVEVVLRTSFIKDKMIDCGWTVVEEGLPHSHFFLL